jgi:hypothetical protein
MAEDYAIVVPTQGAWETRGFSETLLNVVQTSADTGVGIAYIP